MENNTIINIIIATLIISAGGITYTFNVEETGIELTCRTNKPIGWTIINDHDKYYESVCKYSTKEWEYANCSDFRSTSSYERYGCNSVNVVLTNKNDTIKKITEGCFCYSDRKCECK